MNFQELLNYRDTCLIHNLPMETLIYTADPPKSPRKIKTKLSLKNLPDAVFLHLRGYPAEGALFLLDGTYTINEGQKEIREVLDNTVHFLRRCATCAKSKNIPYTDAGMKITTLNDIRDQAHFYTFHLFPVIDTDTSHTYMIGPGKEVVKHYRDDKFYHMSASVGGGEASFKLGNCAGTDIIERLITGMMNLQVPKFDPIRIQNIDQMVEKIKIYNLFS